MHQGLGVADAADHAAPISHRQHRTQFVGGGGTGGGAPTAALELFNRLQIKQLNQAAAGIKAAKLPPWLTSDGSAIQLAPVAGGQGHAVCAAATTRPGDQSRRLETVITITPIEVGIGGIPGAQLVAAKFAKGQKGLTQADELVVADAAHGQQRVSGGEALNALNPQQIIAGAAIAGAIAQGETDQILAIAAQQSAVGLVVTGTVKAGPHHIPQKRLRNAEIGPQVDIKDQGGGGWDCPRGPIAVGQGRGNHQPHLGTHGQALEPQIPASDHPAGTEREIKGPAPWVKRAIERRSIGQGAAVIDQQTLTGAGERS